MFPPGKANRFKDRGLFHYGTLLGVARTHHELSEHDKCALVDKEALEGFELITSSVHSWNGEVACRLGRLQGTATAIGVVR